MKKLNKVAMLFATVALASAAGSAFSMAHMGGKVMAEWLKTTNPELKILFTSGYMDDAIARHGVLATGVEFLAKPYTPATLCRKVRGMLDAK